MKNMKEKIIEQLNEKGRVEIYSSIVDHFEKGTHCVPYTWGEDYFIKILPNPGGNKMLLHFGRRLFKRVGGKWLIHNSYYKIKNKEVKSEKELIFILNSSLFTSFVNSVNWE